MNSRSLVLDTLEVLELPYWVTGSDALSLTGYARSTVDTDIVVDIPAMAYEAQLRPALEARGGSARQTEDATRILAAGSLDLEYCRWAAAQLGVGPALEAAVAVAHAG